jgi:hypothetical protein
MKDNFNICRPYGAEDLMGFGFYKDATPTAFAGKMVCPNPRRSKFSGEVK